VNVEGNRQDSMEDEKLDRRRRELTVDLMIDTVRGEE
jgi:hypothetical protein